MAHETARRCRFSTDRLLVGEWHHLAETHELELVDVVCRTLTAATTAALPPEWHGDFDRARAIRWIEQRNAESPTLLVVERATGEAVGVIILFETGDRGSAHVDLRLGYVLAEQAWGRGLGTELVAGLVAWARSEPGVVSLSGGVAHGNDASARILHKSGFDLAEERDGEQIYVLRVG